MIALVQATLPMISVLQYNLLAESYASPSRYKYVTTQNLNATNRLNKIIARVEQHMPSILCFQECEKAVFATLSTRWARSYKGYFAISRGRTEGVAIFFALNVFTFVDVHTLYLDAYLQTPKVGLVVKLKINGKEIAVGTIHLSGDPNKPSLPCEEVSIFLNDIARHYMDVPLLFCGDLNSEPSSTVCSILKQDPLIPANDRQPYTLASAYEEVYGSDPQVTFVTDQIRQCVDYIYYRKDRFDVLAAEGLPLYKNIAAQGYMPNNTEGSDHLPLMATFMMK